MMVSLRDSDCARPRNTHRNPPSGKRRCKEPVFKIGRSAITVKKKRTDTVGYICHSALWNEWSGVAHHRASPAVALLSGLALQVRHLVELLIEFLSFFSLEMSRSHWTRRSYRRLTATRSAACDFFSPFTSLYDEVTTH
jgi:hypothetical protein